MPSILIIEKTGTVKPYTTKTLVEEDLYKRAGFKSRDGFEKRTTWTIPLGDDIPYSIDLYGKTAGRAGQENKYDFPPPVDSVLFFGSCVLVARQSDKILDISPKDWENVYEHLFGGFDDLGEEDSSDESEEDVDPAVPTTKEGYAKDGFVVEDDESDESGLDVSSEEEYIPPKKTATKRSKAPAKKPKVSDKVASVAAWVLDESTGEPDVSVENETYLNCSNELTEEDYVM